MGVVFLGIPGCLVEMLVIVYNTFNICSNLVKRLTFEKFVCVIQNVMYLSIYKWNKIYTWYFRFPLCVFCTLNTEKGECNLIHSKWTILGLFYCICTFYPFSWMTKSVVVCIAISKWTVLVTFLLRKHFLSFSNMDDKVCSRIHG